MNRLKRGVPYFARMRRALLAGLLGLGLVVLCSGVVFARAPQIGPHAFIDSATDDGGGRIRISWSLEAQPPEGYYFANSHPEKVCVTWVVVENGVMGSATVTCFTSEISSQADLIIDTGVGGDGPATVYSLTLVPHYRTAFGSTPLWPHEDGVWRRTKVTLNASS